MLHPELPAPSTNFQPWMGAQSRQGQTQAAGVVLLGDQAPGWAGAEWLDHCYNPPPRGGHLPSRSACLTRKPGA